MALLSDSEDDELLEKGQVAEERIGSVDYDVWKCPACSHRFTLRYAKWLSQYDKCPQCSNRTKSSTESVINAATTSSAAARSSSRNVRSAVSRTSSPKCCLASPSRVRHRLAARAAVASVAVALVAEARAGDIDRPATNQPPLRQLSGGDVCFLNRSRYPNCRGYSKFVSHALPVLVWPMRRI